MKTFAWLLVKVVGIPTAIIAILYLLRIRIDQRIIDCAANLAWDWGPSFVSILLLLVGAESTHRVINDDRSKYTKKYLNANPEARIARAHLVFYSIWNSAKENGHKWSLEQKQTWDENVRDELIEHCEEEALFTYLNTTRGEDEDPLRGISLLQEDAFSKAVHDIKSLLDMRLKLWIKKPS